MIITSQGENYFKLQSGDDTILIDPTDQRSFRGAGIILNTLSPALADKPSEDQEVFWIEHGGEYEVEGTRINGWLSGFNEYESEGRENTVYLVDFKGFRFAVFGFLPDEPESEILGEMEEVDVAFIPADGDSLIDPDKAAKLIRQIEPSLIIPAVFDEVDPLLKELNEKECKEEEKIVLKKSDMKAGDMEVRCLKQ